MRVQNLGKHPKERCDACQNTSFVMVSEGDTIGGVRYAELTAPCPSCERGAAVEFGESGKERWPDGYWQGRPIPYVPMPATGRSLSKAESRELSEEYRARLNGVGKPMEQPKDTERRLTSMMTSLEPAGHGECDDCHDEAHLFRLGRVRVCTACAHPRLKVAMG